MLLVPVGDFPRDLLYEISLRARIPIGRGRLDPAFALNPARGQYDSTRLLAELKARFPQITLVAGGIHATVLPGVLLSAGCDYAVIGDLHEIVPVTDESGNRVLKDNRPMHVALTTGTDTTTSSIGTWSSRTCSPDQNPVSMP